MTDAQKLRIAVQILAEIDPDTVARLHNLAVALIAGDKDQGEQIQLDIQGRQVLRQALGHGWCWLSW